MSSATKAPGAEGLTHEAIEQTARRIMHRIEDADHYFLCDADFEEAVDIAKQEIYAALAQREAAR